MSKPKSETKKDTNLVERLLGGHHSKTTISDGGRRVERHAETPRESERRASEAWKKGKSD